MEFLASKSIVHGDLAARNVLLTSDLTAKLSDFGFSLVTSDNDNDNTIDSETGSPTEAGVLLRTEQFPVRWMAPESLHSGRVTTASDVWAYGVVLWEIFSVGSFPYEGKEISFCVR